MLNKNEKEQLQDAEIQEELEALKEKKRQANTSILPTKWKGMEVFLLIISLFLIATGVVLAFMGFILDWNYKSFNLHFPIFIFPCGLFVVAGVISLIFAVRALTKRRREFGKSIMVSPDGDVPEYPEETIVKKSVEALQVKKKKVERPMAIKKVYSVDPEKRVIEMDKRKVERVLDHNITFPKLREALAVNLRRRAINLSEEDLNVLVSSLAYSRCFFLQGIDEKYRQPMLDALAETMVAQRAMIMGEGRLAPSLGKLPQLPKNTSFILGIDGLAPEDAEGFFRGCAGEIADYSVDHLIAETYNVSNNLILLVFLGEGNPLSIPANLLAKCPLLHLVPSALEVPSPEDGLTVRSSGDEIRYMSLKEKAQNFLNDELVAGFDTLFDFAYAKGFLIGNDVENAFERQEAAYILLGVNHDKAAGMVLAYDYIPYLMKVLDESAISEEGGLRETLEKAFDRSDTSSYVRNALRTLNKKEKPKEEKPAKEEPAEGKEPEPEGGAES